MDVVAFASLLTFHIWVILPLLPRHSIWARVVPLLAIGFAVYSLYRKGVSLKTIGLRLDNFLPALKVYSAAALGYAGVVLIWYRSSLGLRHIHWHGLIGVAWFLLWAFLQEFCLLAFLLTRLRQMVGRDLPAALLTSLLFAFFHLPNMFLMLYVLGGGIVLTLLFLRRPNLWAAMLAHAMASALVGRLLPAAITSGMKVGPLYWPRG